MRLNWMLHANPTYLSASPLVFDFQHTELTAANFSTLAQGGFGAGALAIKDPPEALIQNAVDNWLTKRVIAVDSSGYIAYEGYVAEIKATMGFHSFVRSIDQFANRVWVQYVYGGYPCPKGTLCKNNAAINESAVGLGTTTQTSYGIKEQWIDLSGQGKTTSALATSAATVTLRTSLRSREFDFQLGYGAEPQDNSLSLSLWGYYTTLQWRKSAYGVNTSTDIATVVKNVLSKKRNVNGTQESVSPFISTDQSNINSTGTNVLLNKERKNIWVQDLIQTALVPGDSNAKELFFQIWEDRTPYLTSRPSAPRYFTRYDDNRIWDAQRHLIQPYQVRAGAFVVSENMNEALDGLTDVYQRERTSFLDHTTYDDIKETILLPPSNHLLSTERMLARARRQLGKYIT